MAKFKISRATQDGKTWKATGINPVTNRKNVIQGGQRGVKVGKYNPKSEKTFDARHDATPMTPKKFVNKLRWDDEAKMGTIIEIPDELFRAKVDKAMKSLQGKSKAIKERQKGGLRKIE